MTNCDDSDAVKVKVEPRQSGGSNKKGPPVVENRYVCFYLCFPFCLFVDLHLGSDSDGSWVSFIFKLKCLESPGG